MIREVTGIAAGTTTIGVTVVRISGSGAFNREGADNESVLILEDTGT
jgi:hypothetical protein